MNKIAMGIWLAMVLVLIAAAMQQNLSGFTSMQGQSPAQNEIVVGVLLPLTGSFAFFGEQAKDGALVALEEINASNKQKIRLVFEDDKCLPSDAVTAYRKLVNFDNPDIIVGPACTGSILSVAPQALGDGREMLAIFDASEAIAKEGSQNKMLHSLGFSSEEEGYLVAEYLISKNLKTAAIIFDEDEWASLVKNAFKRRFESLGGTVLAEEAHNVKDNDYKTNILKVVTSSPQALYIAPAYNGGFALKQLRELGVQIPVFGPDTFGINGVLEVAGNAADGAIYSNVVIDENSAGALKFQEKYSAKYGKESDSLLFVAFGYDSVKIAYRILSQYNSINGGFAKINYGDGIISVAGFDSNGMAKMKPVLMKIENQKFERLDE